MSIFRGIESHSSKNSYSRAVVNRGRPIRALFIGACAWFVLPATAMAQSIPDPSQSVDRPISDGIELEQAV